MAGRPVLALGAVVAVLAGAAGGDARLVALDRSALRPLIGRKVSLRAFALERPRTSQSGLRSVAVRVAAGRAHGERLRVRLGRGGGWPAVAPGAEVALRGQLEALAPYEAFERRRGAHAALVLASARATGRARRGMLGALDRARARAEAGAGAGLGAREAALARGMVLGEDEAIAEPVRADFRVSGLAHLLAVSGQNVMLLAILGLAAGRALGVALRPRLLGVLALIAVYVPLTGAGPSIQRAGVMGGAAVVAALAGRPASRWYALLLAAAATLALNPRTSGDPGWQLSFVAVVALLVWAPRLAGALTRRGVPAALADALAVTLAATAGTAPLMAFQFDRLSLASLPANVLAAPAVAPIMWAGMVAAALGQLGAPGLAAAGLVNALGAYPLAYLEWLAHASASVPHASVGARLGSPLALAVAYGALGAGAALAPRIARALGPAAARPRARLVGAAAAAVGALALLAGAAAGGAPWTQRGSALGSGELRVSFLDVGQGDATLLQDGRRAVLVDAGPPDGPILARLRAAGVGRLDVLVVTHQQADHEGGAAAVLRAHAVGLLVDGGVGAHTPGQAAIARAAAGRRLRAIAPDAGQVIRVGRLELRVLWPPREPAGAPPAGPAGADPNQRAIVLHVRDGAFDLLLPADAESDVTAGLPLEPVEALKVAHHGSADPGLPALLARLRPRVAAIEVGAHNPYGHPAPATLRALRAVPRVYRTDRDGTVRLTVARDGEMHVETGP